MPEMKNHIDEVFRDKLRNYREVPPADSWAYIKDAVGEKSGRKILMPVWRIAAGIAILITAGYLFHSVRKPERAVITEKREVQAEAPEKTTSVEQTVRKDEVVAKDQNEKNQIYKKKPESNESIIPLDVTTAEKESNLVQAVSYDSDSVNKISVIIMTPGPEGGIHIADLPYGLVPFKVIPDRIPERRALQTSKIIRTEIPVKTDEKLNAKKDIWSLTAQLSPVYSYRNLIVDDQASITSLNQSESGIVSLGGGLQVGYKASDRISFYGGLMYARLGLEVNNVVRYSIISQNTYGSETMVTPGNRVNTYALNNSTGIINSDKLDAVVINPKSSNTSISSNQDMKTDIFSYNLSSDDKIDQYFDFLEIPFLLRYRVLKGKFNMNLIGGLSTNILIGNSVYLISDEGKSRIGQTENIHNINYSGNVGIGFDYDLGKKFLFTFEPQFRYYLNSINENNLVSNRPYSVGMYTGIRYIF